MVYNYKGIKLKQYAILDDDRRMKDEVAEIIVSIHQPEKKLPRVIKIARQLLIKKQLRLTINCSC